ncbi:hypothetical protein TWF481_006112 [Arthrobotrys musiformis]|uniref:Uncharacterized protein n=1 Tax=Arthrobotrys musiformis TaxID=47236 RepID=A0AAV9WH50_9PEZI
MPTKYHVRPSLLGLLLGLLLFNFISAQMTGGTDPTGNNPNNPPNTQVEAPAVATNQEAVEEFISETSGGVPTAEEVAAEAVQQSQDLGVGNEPVNGAVNDPGTQQAQVAGQTNPQPTGPANPNDDSAYPNININNPPRNNQPLTANSGANRITLPMEIAQEIYSTYAPKLEEARQRRFPEGYPGPEVSPVEPSSDDIWATEVYTSLIIRPETWQRFFNQTTLFGYGETDLVEYVWWACSNVQNYRISLDELFLSLARWVKRTDQDLYARLNTVWGGLGKIMKMVSNRDFNPKEGKISGVYAPGICDTPGGYLAAPTPQEWKTNKKGRDALKNALLKKLLDYKQLRPNEILLNDGVFIAVFSVLVTGQRGLAGWLTDELTPVMRDINAKCCADRNLLANTHMRPAGLWDRKTMGYKAYWNEKYGKIYRYIPPDFSYWNAWESKNVERSPEKLQMLIYATHATAAGLTRGAMAFMTELFVDFSAKVWALGQYAGLPDPDFGYAEANRPFKPVSFTLSPKFMVGAAEKGSTHFLYGASYPSDYPVGLEYWDDAAEIERNRWRDQELDIIRAHADLFDREKAAEPDEVPVSGQSTGASTPRNGPGNKIGNSATQYRAVKKPRK